MKDYVLTLLVAATFTYMLTPLVRRFAQRIGAIKQPRDRDVHTTPIPLLGGLAMFGGLVAALLVADQIPQLRDDAFANTGMVAGLLLAGGLLVVVGIIDDRWGISPLTKAAGQVAAGGILVATGTQLNWLPLPGGSIFDPTSNEATLLTIVIVVATINAVNFIDGLDGLAAGIVAIAAISFFLYYYSMTRVINISSLAAPALVSAILIGMCLGFLPHNFSPASIFMGDTGSMLLGLLLAYAPISSITSVDPALLAHNINRYPEILPLLLPAALLVIPYADLLLAVVRRTRAGQSPFAPDRKHLHHRMLEIGHSQRASVLIMYLWAAVFSGTVVWLSIQRTEQRGSTNHHGEPVIVFIAITAAAVAALLLLAMPKLRWWGRSRLESQADPPPAVPQPPEIPLPAALATAMPELASAGAMELRPPAAAPVAAAASAEPQLVAAAAVARMSPLAAPVPPSGSASAHGEPGRPASAWGEPDGPDRQWADGGWADDGWTDDGWTDNGWADRGWPHGGDPGRTGADSGGTGPNGAVGGAADRDGAGWGRANEGHADQGHADQGHADQGHADQGHADQGRADRGRGEPPAAAWTLGDRGSDRELPDWRPHSAAPPHRPVDAGATGRPVARSIIGTPPPAVSGVDPTRTGNADPDYLDSRGAGQIES
jgi:UDP-GlcNAc:undecaprenyl-phosphate/decaprenyl-phosphate GlcNAc-1-phosphate transferase